MKLFRHSLGTALVAVCTAICAQADPSAQPTVTVRVADLNLQSAPGVDTLFRRIRGAAERVCGEHDGQRITQKQAYTDCVDQAMSTAMNRVDPQLLARVVR